MRVVVTGGRELVSKELVWTVLDQLAPVELHHGDADGVDRHARDWARAHGIAEIAHPADWATYGTEAGKVRNYEMSLLEGIDTLVAFPGGSGTANMVARARAKGWRIHYARATP